MEPGLSSQQVITQRLQFGDNTVTTNKPSSAFSLFLSQFPTLMNTILFLAALLSFFLQNTLDGVFILTIVLINGLFGFLQEFRAQKALEKLTSYAPAEATVIRDRKAIKIPIQEVVVQDLIPLVQGDILPADGTITTSFHLEIDESILTGESIPAIKEKGATAYRGTFVTKGRGFLHVGAIGQKTRLGQITQTFSQIKPDATPLQKQVTSLSKLLSLSILLISALLIPLGVWEHRPLFPMILVAVSIAVAAIPESLPGVITIALSVGTNRLAHKKAIVKHLAAIETLGTTQIILTDKTGTLTQNSMHVKQYDLLDAALLPHALEACIRGNTAYATDTEAGSIIVGDKTDGALLLWAKHLDGTYKDVLESGTILDEYAFDSKTKTISTVVNKHGSIYVFARGAVESLLERSTLSEKEKDHILSLATTYAQQSLRVIALAYKKETHAPISRSHAEQHLTFLGIIGLYDPPRISAKRSLQKASSAGIRVVMVTGDNPITAVSIAKEVGLIDTDETAILGEDIQKLSDEEVFTLLTSSHVFARMSPEDKLRLVAIAKDHRLVVAVTGDGVNDALALQKADVGVAMGETGSDVAKEAADVVLANDDISTLVNAIAQGRQIYTSMITAITYLLAGNLSEILLVVLATLFGHQLILLPTQILWMNLVTDGWPALALASEDHMASLGKEPPRSVHSYLLSPNRIVFIVACGLGLAGVLFTLFLFLADHTNITRARTIIFGLLICSHMILAFLVRKHPFKKVNTMLLVSIIATLLAQITISTLPFFQELFALGW